MVGAGGLKKGEKGEKGGRRRPFTTIPGFSWGYPFIGAGTSISTLCAKDLFFRDCTFKAQRCRSTLRRVNTRQNMSTLIWFDLF